MYSFENMFYDTFTASILPNYNIRKMIHIQRLSLIKIYNQAKKFKHIHFLTKEEYYMVIELGALAILQRNINAFINFLLFYNLI